MRHDDRTDPNPYLFVVGCSRSGTTMLRRMLDNHPLLAVVDETHFLPKPIEHLPAGVDVPLTPELVEWVRTYKRTYKLRLPDAVFDEAAEGCSSYAEFVGALYSAFARLQGKPLAGEKTPHFVQKLPLLHGLFPWARTVHLIRDGRDVALSTMGWATGGRGPSKHALWAEEPVAVCALWWLRHVRTGRRDGAGLGPEHYREVRYEDLVARPQLELRGLAAFLDLPDAPEMAAYHVGRTRDTPGLSAKKAWLPPTPGLRDWRAQMSPRDTALFEALAGDMLDELGYGRSVESFPAEVVESAERCRVWWEEVRRPRPQGKADRAPLLS